MILDIVIFGLSITSSWGNGHAVTYRALANALHQRGHKVTFLERDVPWYRDNRDLTDAEYCRIGLYDNLREVPRRFARLVANANLVIIGSCVPDGVRLADWITSRARGITAFYDIDTPVTLAGLDSGETPYVSAALIPRFDLYLSFTGGPLLNVIEEVYGSPRARALHCTADLSSTAEPDVPPRWALGYLGTYAPDRQGALEALLLDTSRHLSDQQFVVAGPKYPERCSVAGKHHPHHPSTAGQTQGILHKPALYPEHNAPPYAGRGIFAQRTPVRGGGGWCSDHDRQMAGPGDLLHARTRDSRRRGHAPGHSGHQTSCRRSAGETSPLPAASGFCGAMRRKIAPGKSKTITWKLWWSGGQPGDWKLSHEVRASSRYLPRFTLFWRHSGIKAWIEDRPAMTPRKWCELPPDPDRSLERLGPTGQFDDCFVSVQNAREQRANPSLEC